MDISRPIRFMLPKGRESEAIPYIQASLKDYFYVRASVDNGGLNTLKKACTFDDGTKVVWSAGGGIDSVKVYLPSKYAKEDIAEEQWREEEEIRDTLLIVGSNTQRHLYSFRYTKTRKLYLKLEGSYNLEEWGKLQLTKFELGKDCSNVLAAHLLSWDSILIWDYINPIDSLLFDTKGGATRLEELSSKFVVVVRDKTIPIPIRLTTVWWRGLSEAEYVVRGYYASFDSLPIKWLSVEDSDSYEGKLLLYWSYSKSYTEESSTVEQWSTVEFKTGLDKVSIEPNIESIALIFRRQVVVCMIERTRVLDSTFIYPETREWVAPPMPEYLWFTYVVAGYSDAYDYLRELADIYWSSTAGYVVTGTTIVLGKYYVPVTGSYEIQDPPWWSYVAIYDIDGVLLNPPTYRTVKYTYNEEHWAPVTFPTKGYKTVYYEMPVYGKNCDLVVKDYSGSELYRSQLPTEDRGGWGYLWESYGVPVSRFAKIV
jgi:hypothetical protein